MVRILPFETFMMRAISISYIPFLPEIEEDSGLRGKLVVQGGEHVGVDEAGIAYIAFERLLIPSFHRGRAFLYGLVERPAGYNPVSLRLGILLYLVLKLPYLMCLLIGFLPDLAQLFARNLDIPSYP